MLITFQRILKSGWLNFSRDGGLVAANIFIMVMAISVVSSLFLFRQASNFLVADLQEKVDIAVYFREQVQPEEIFKVEEELLGIPEVKEVKYVSSAEALEIFNQRHQDDPLLLEALDEVGVNPFLASLNIKAFEASQYEAVAGFFDSARFEGLIEKVDYYQRKPVIEKIFSLTSNINLFGIILSVLLVLVAVLVAFNNIRLAIYGSREEIKIQRLVGASNWFIRGPFLVQGGVIGVMAAFISFVVFAGAFWLLGPKLSFLFPGVSLVSFFVGSFWQVFLIQLLAGVSLGMLSSLIAVRRYLKV